MEKWNKIVNPNIVPQIHTQFGVFNFSWSGLVWFGFSFFIVLKFYLSNLFTQHATGTHDTKTKSRIGVEPTFKKRYVWLKKKKNNNNFPRLSVEEKRMFFQQMELDSWIITVEKKMNFNPYFTLQTKTNSKWIINLNINFKTIKLLKNNKTRNRKIL